MCFTIPQKIVKINQNQAFFADGTKARTNLEKCRAGDYALVQKGFVIKKMNRKEAERTLELLGGKS